MMASLALVCTAPLPSHPRLSIHTRPRCTTGKQATVGYAAATKIGPKHTPQPPCCMQIAAKHASVVVAVHNLFEIRPCWLLPDLRDRVPTAQAGQVAAMEAAVNILAYRFQTGMPGRYPALLPQTQPLPPSDIPLWRHTATTCQESLLFKQPPAVCHLLALALEWRKPVSGRACSPGVLHRWFRPMLPLQAGSELCEL